MKIKHFMIAIFTSIVIFSSGSAAFANTLNSSHKYGASGVLDGAEAGWPDTYMKITVMGSTSKLHFYIHGKGKRANSPRFFCAIHPWNKNYETMAKVLTNISVGTHLSVFGLKRGICSQASISM